MTLAAHFSHKTFLAENMWLWVGLLTTIWPLLCNHISNAEKACCDNQQWAFSCFGSRCAGPTNLTFQHRSIPSCRSSPTEYLFSTAPLYILHRKNQRIIVCICRVSFEILISIECRFFILLNCDSWAMLNSANLISNTSCANLEFCIR